MKKQIVECLKKFQSIFIHGVRVNNSIHNIHTYLPKIYLRYTSYTYLYEIKSEKENQSYDKKGHKKHYLPITKPLSYSIWGFCIFPSEWKISNLARIRTQVTRVRRECHSTTVCSSFL